MMDSQKLVEITIDDTKVRVPAGTTILEAASGVGIDIPTLCHHAELSPSGACRVCIVEISRPARNPSVSWIDSACVCPVGEGFHVQTNSPRVVRERKLILELLISRAPGSERIQELSAEYGVSADKFAAADGGKSNCILCGLCVRVCNELIGANAIGTAQRGIKKEVTSPYLVAASLCIGCMACVNVCPTGVIEFQIEKGKLKKEDWGVALDMMICPSCGKPVGTGIQMARVKKDVAVTDELLAYCPACRRQKTKALNFVQQEHTGV